MKKFYLVIYLSILFFTASAQNIYTITGTGTATNSGDGSVATSASIMPAEFMCHDNIGNIYLAVNEDIRKIDATTGVITHIAGNSSGSAGPSPDGSTAATSSLFSDVLQIGH